MNKLKKMAVFARVVELGSFAAAAADLNVTPAIIGRHVADLESLLDVRLINRTTRSMEVTEAGLRYYQGSKSMLEQIAALEQEVSDPQGALLSGVIRIAAPEGIGAPLLLDAVESFPGQPPRGVVRPGVSERTNRLCQYRSGPCDPICHFAGRQLTDCQQAGRNQVGAVRCPGLSANAWGARDGRRA